MTEAKMNASTKQNVAPGAKNDVSDIQVLSSNEKE